LRAPPTKRGLRPAPPSLVARLSGDIRLEAQADGSVAACFDGYSTSLGKFTSRALEEAQALRTGLPLGALAPDGGAVDREIGLLVRRLARRGLLEYRLGEVGGKTFEVIIEPQIPDYWPHMPKLGANDVIVLSRFAYLRRRGNAMVLESPRAGALFRIGDPKIVAFLALLSTPQKLAKLRRQESFSGTELLALLVDCEILFKTDAGSERDLRPVEGDDSLVLWDFHDLLFHTRSTEGRNANPLGGRYPYADVLPLPPAVRPRWPGTEIDLGKPAAPDPGLPSPFARLLHERHSARDFDDRQPIMLAELSRFLESTARIQSKWADSLDFGDDGPAIDYAARPYPSGGGAYPLELYLAVANCDGLARGFYHYDADRHALVLIDARPQELEAMLSAAQFAMGADAVPQLLITIAARFGRVSWKYSSVAYSLILKEVGVLTQTFYLMATEMGLGGCAIGSLNIDLFAKATGLEFHVEGPVGQFAIGRGSEAAVSE
jgi:SagB-type dehydrogenase family enzyme